METAERKPNWYVRTLIVLLCAFMVWMAAYKFLYGSPSITIDYGLITLLLIVVILSLSEAFDNFSIGTIISISRKVNEKEKKISDLETRNEQLFAQILSISNHQAQSQSHTNVYGDYHATQTIGKASPEEIEAKQSAEAASPSNGAAESGQVAYVPAPARLRIDQRKIEQLVLQKYLDGRQIKREDAIIDAKIIDQVSWSDPIANVPVLFDAYVKNSAGETFIEIRPYRMSPMFRDRLYVMLSKLNNYRTSKKTDVTLDMIMYKIAGEELSGFMDPSRTLSLFSPSISSGLLRTPIIDLTAEDVAQFKQE